MVLAQDFLAGFIALIIYKLGVRIFKSQSVGVIAGILFSLEPMSIYWNSLLMFETLASFLFIYSIYLFICKRYYFSALIMGLATLTRPSNLYFFPLLLLMYIYEHKEYLFNKIPGAMSKFFWKKLLLMFFVFFITIFPWALRNKIQFNTWDISSNGWFALYYFNASEFAIIKNVPYKKVPYDFPPVDPSYHPGEIRNAIYYYEFFNTPFYKKYILDLIAKYPIDYLKFHITSAVEGFQNHDYRYIMDYVLLAKVPSFNKSIGNFLVNLGQYLWLFIYSLVIVGFLVKGPKKWQVFLVSFYLTNNLLTGYISTVSAGGRYNLPFLPITLLLASYGLVSLWDYRKYLTKRL